VRGLALAACGGCALGATAVATSTPAKPATRTLTLKMTEDRSAAHTLDVPPKGLSTGDTFTYSGALRRGRRIVGRLEGIGTAADAKYKGNIGTQYFVLHDGTIAVIVGGQDGAPGVGRPDSRIWNAIAGGSGKYAGARGWVSGHDLPDGSVSMTFHLMP
jgi:hypothetical protein